MEKNCLKLKLAVCFLLLLAAVLTGICAGAVWISPLELIRELSAAGLSPNERIILYIRLPRVLASCLAGAALAVSGVLIQAVLDNPLAAPNIIGVNAGAGMLVILCTALFPTAARLLPAAAFLGALLAALLVYGVARRISSSRMTIILTGVCVSSLFNAVIDTIATLFPDTVTGITSFKLGGVSGVTLGSLFPACLFIAVGIIAAIVLGHELDILSLGENTARSLGMNVGRTSFSALAAAAVLAGAAVSFSGLIGFVGLIVPHISRKLLGSCENVKLIPFCALLGGAFLTLCDTAARTLAAPYELPLGIIVSYIGVPFFIWLLFSRREE